MNEQKLGQEREHRAFQYHTLTLASHRIKFSVGTGRADFAQAGGRDAAKLAEALERVAALLEWVPGYAIAVRA
jgi:alanyl-tRNA synthetase